MQSEAARLDEAPASVAASVDSDRLRQLRERIRSIERKPPIEASGCADPGRAAAERAPEPPWALGEPALDRLLGPGGLETGAVHEIRPGGSDWAAAAAAARLFTLALAARRLATCPRGLQAAPVLWCQSVVHAREHGAPYGPGLAALGIDPARLVVVEPAKAADVLWAIEEGLACGGLALVLGQVDGIDLTPARRLALAAARTSTPCLLMTHPRAAAAAATATRWRIAAAPGAPDGLDAEAPGAPRLTVDLERCRGRPQAVQPVSFLPVSFLLEWCHAASRLRVASGLADRASCQGLPGPRPRAAVAGER